MSMLCKYSVFLCFLKKVHVLFICYTCVTPKIKIISIFATKGKQEIKPYGKK